MLPIAIVGGGFAALLWWLLSEKPGGIYALFGKRFLDGWEVYIISYKKFSKGKGKEDVDKLFEGSDLADSGESDILEYKNATSYNWWEYVAINKVEEKVYTGFIASRFDIFDKNTVVEAIHEILNLPDSVFTGKNKGYYYDHARHLKLTRFASKYVTLESLEKVKKVKEWL